jgi:hypothetical protein
VGGGIYLNITSDFVYDSSSPQFSFGPSVNFDDSQAQYGYDIFVNVLSGIELESIIVNNSFIEYDYSLMTRTNRYLLSGYDNGNSSYPIPLLRYLIPDECLLYLINGWEEECVNNRDNCMVKNKDCFLRCDERYNETVCFYILLYLLKEI